MGRGQGVLFIVPILYYHIIIVDRGSDSSTVYEASYLVTLKMDTVT